jgi:isopentenyl-diphosphate delta-isomerase
VLFFFVLNSKNEIMLHNVLIKYPTGLIPVAVIKEKESNNEAGSRRLFEEMGFKTELKELFILFIRPRLIMV